MFELVGGAQRSVVEVDIQQVERVVAVTGSQQDQSDGVDAGEERLCVEAGLPALLWPWRTGAGRTDHFLRTQN